MFNCAFSYFVVFTNGKWGEAFLSLRERAILFEEADVGEVDDKTCVQAGCSHTKWLLLQITTSTRPESTGLAVRCAVDQQTVYTADANRALLDQPPSSPVPGLHATLVSLPV